MSASLFEARCNVPGCIWSIKTMNLAEFIKANKDRDLEHLPKREATR